MTSTYQYRLLGKANWGIAIGIQINVNDLLAEELKKDRVYEIKSNILIDFSKVLYLNDKQQTTIVNGLKWYLKDKGKLDDSLISIVEIKINYLDYQDEGLFFAFAEWASEYFDLEKPKYDFTFNKKLNRYEFPLLTIINQENQK